ncbi:hypothetical protein IPZ55_06730 [Streptomyces sp. A10(2020)]|uniref:ATP-binding protein n=1 Tax=Streptomyces sp. A10(2020) TaxID=2782013 RepID=UPI001F5DBA8A|nr:ATP-binding protein [Streptomyces sp. A10(2020)]UNR56320.1 hypothetical protein IPZ55_06730 [Streptomyces sp. A10(2020)]
MLRYEANLAPGLNVIAAPNSFGKSTLLQGVIYALGLEGMFSSSRKPPFGPALLTLADWPDGTRSPVRESWVSLTIANEQGAYMRCKRFVRGDGIDTSLIMTWQGSNRAELERASRVDMFVRQPGAAFRELGFHRALAEFVGWDLPTVPGFNSAEVSLYLEALFPLFYVEQKSGWSGVAPRMPTYLGIRDVLKRSVEYVLGLSALERLTALAAVKTEEDDVKKRWQSASDRLGDAAKSLNCRIFLHQDSPVTPARRQHCVVEVMEEESWVPLERQIDVWRQRLRDLERVGVEPAGQHTNQAREELSAAENSIRDVGGRIRLIDEQLNLSRTDSDALATRSQPVLMRNGTVSRISANSAALAAHWVSRRYRLMFVRPVASYLTGEKRQQESLPTLTKQLRRSKRRGKRFARRPRVLNDAGQGSNETGVPFRPHCTELCGKLEHFEMN